MKIVQASTKRVYEVEQKPMIRLLSSGIKLTEFMMDAMSLEVGDRLSYAKDEDNEDRLYIFKSEEGSIIGKNKAFTNSGLIAEMKRKASSIDLEIKGGNNIVFTMDEEGTEADGVDYFGLDFSKVVLGGDDEEETANDSGSDSSFEE